MRASAVRAPIALFIFLAIPVVYNACGAIGQSATGADFASDSSCKVTNRVGFENGQAILKLAAPPSRSVFASRKVVLSAADPFAKDASAATDVVYPAGTSLAVVVDAACLRDAAVDLTDAPISRSARASSALRDDLSSQAISYVLPAAMTESELDAAVEREACVTGVGLNHSYQLESLSLNDPQRSSQSYLAFDQADAAYNLAFGAQGMATTGSNVVVAVLDSGVDYTHPELVSKLVPGYGADVANNTSNPVDVSSVGHGTHVSGMIAAASNNGVGISGVMPFRAQILAVRIVPSVANPSISSQMVYSGVQYAISKGASVINLSISQLFTGAQTDSVLQQAMQNAVDNGITVVIAMGNASAQVDGVNNSVMPVQFSTMNGVIGVGAVNAVDGQKSSFSNYGPTYAEIAAVGDESGTTGVFSTLPVSLGSYGRLAGTSQATPQVTAAAALAIAMIRNAYGATPDPAAIESLILDSADKRGELSTYFRNGNRLNLSSLVQLVRLRYPLTATGKSTGC